jgi:hypothetical protein
MDQVGLNKKIVSLLLMKNIKLLEIIGISYFRSFYMKARLRVGIIKRYVEKKIHFIHLMIRK